MAKEIQQETCQCADSSFLRIDRDGFVSLRGLLEKIKSASSNLKKMAVLKLVLQRQHHAFNGRYYGAGTSNDGNDIVRNERVIEYDILTKKLY